MASHESFYTGSSAGAGHNPLGGHTIETPSSPIAYGYSAHPPAPPPPPPKPAGHSHGRVQSTDPSRTGTPVGGFLSINHTSSNNPAQLRPPPPLPDQSGTPNPTPSPFPAAQYAPSPNPNRPQTPTYPQSQTNLQSGGRSTDGRPGGGAAQSQQYQQQNPQSQIIPPPSFDQRWLPSSPDLASRPITDLTPLVSETQLLQSIATSHPSFSSSQMPLQQAIQANQAMASQVLQLENQVRQHRSQTAQLLLSQTSLQTQWRRKQSEMDDALSPWGPRAMYQRLVSGISEQEAYLKAVHESFLDGDSASGVDSGYYGSGNGKASEKEVSEWVKRIREGTTILEKRREMRARWDDGRVGGWR